MSQSQPSQLIHLTAHVDAPVSKVFEFVSSHENFAKLFGATCEVVVPGSPTRDGVGSVRRALPWPLTFEEEIVESEKDRKIAYKLIKGAPLKNHLGTINFAPGAEGGTDIDYSIVFDPVVYGTGWAFRRGLAKLWHIYSPGVFKTLEE